MRQDRKGTLNRKGTCRKGKWELDVESSPNEAGQKEHIIQGCLGIGGQEEGGNMRELEGKMGECESVVGFRAKSSQNVRKRTSNGGRKVVADCLAMSFVFVC